MAAPLPGYQGHWCIDTKWIPGSLLDERLRAVAVMHVEVDDEHAIGMMFLARVVRGDRDVAEETESHRGVGERMMARAAARR